MDLFNLPKVVLEGHLLPYLEWKDLLNLRMVCKAAKPVVQNYLKVYHTAAPEIEIRTRDDEQGRNLEAFLKMGVYSSRIFLNNRSGAGFYENNNDETIQKFLEEHGAKLKHLRVNYWTLYCTGKERQFLEGLVNLEKFEVDHFAMTPWQNGLHSKDIVPTAFRHLMILKLNKPLDMNTTQVIACANNLLTSCPNLMVLSLPCVGSLKLTISCEGILDAGEEAEVNARTMFNFRYNVVPSAAAELRNPLKLNFTTTYVGVPDLGLVVASCPRLTGLTFRNWIGTNKQLSRLWRGLWYLPQISFENCGGLNDSTFIGDDTANPVFGWLRCLRSLTLSGLDQMPGITDTLFREVICHLRLIQLVLTSNQPVRSITYSGIESLLSGRGGFQDTIASFPFTGWSLENVSQARFQQLATSFQRPRPPAAINYVMNDRQ